ncbi:hypothetical protein LCGC14_2226330, partial [marine sediment metagenome]
GRYEESLSLAEQTYKESLGLGKNLQSVDCFILIAESLLWLSKFDEAFDLIKQGKELLKALPQELLADYNQRESYLAYIKGFIYAYTGKIDLGINCLKQSLELGEKTDFKRINALTLKVLAWYTAMYKGDMDLAFPYIKKGLAIAKESKNKFTIAQCLVSLGEIYHFTGDWERALKIFKESLSLFEELDNKVRMWVSLFNMARIYRDFTEDIDSASEYIKMSLAVYNENEEANYLWAGSRFYTAITIALKKGDHEGAKKYLQNFKHINSQTKDKYVDLGYRLSKALILKASPRFRDIVKAEKILRQIVTEEVFYLEYIRVALINLCDILLGEFRLTNNLEILNELEPLIMQLLSLAEKTQSHSIQVETYLFQAKLALLSFNVKKSRRFLTQAQQVAERYNLDKLAQEISSEHKNLIDSLELWEQLKESKAPLSERFKLAQISEQMERMHRARMVLTAQIREEKVVISKEKKICLVCRGEVFGFSYACKCGANYCENCARAVADLENVCWACDNPIDYSKPSQPYKEEEERIEVQEKVKKK